MFDDAEYVVAMKVKELDKKATGQEVGQAGNANAKPGGCGPGDLLLIIAGPKLKTQESMGKFRHLMGTELGLRNEGFRALWVVNFPMLEWDDEEERFSAKHHPFTSPWTEEGQAPLLGMRVKVQWLAYQL
eukprot:Skav204505  [mRNA]  locus=scaffold527:209804:217471:+ [translate_table: standard]